MTVQGRTESGVLPRGLVVVLAITGLLVTASAHNHQVRRAAIIRAGVPS